MAVKLNRKRYIWFEIISDKEIKFEIAKQAIFDSAIKLFGSLGISKSHLKVLPDFYKKNQGVLSINHDYISKTKLALAMITKIGNQKTIFQSKKVFGTLKKIKYIFRG